MCYYFSAVVSRYHRNDNLEEIMSDVSQGAGWWQASDGKWYPPERHPNYQPSAPPPPAGSPQGASSVPSTAGKNLPQFSFDIKRWSQTDRITAIATLVLLVSLFLPWFSYNFGFGSISVDGLWHGWMYLVLLLCLALLGYFVARAGFSEMPFKLPMAEEQMLLIATGANAVLTILAFVFKPGGYGFSGIGWSFGAFVGLVASIVAAVPLAGPAIKARRH
ncbi:MAG: hypothetical protein ACYDGY_10875 [Acidimicrobiales bacterium]